MFFKGLELVKDFMINIKFDLLVFLVIIQRQNLSKTYYTEKVLFYRLTRSWNRGLINSFREINLTPCNHIFLKKSYGKDPHLG